MMSGLMKYLLVIEVEVAMDLRDPDITKKGVQEDSPAMRIAYQRARPCSGIAGAVTITVDESDSAMGQVLLLGGFGTGEEVNVSTVYLIDLATGVCWVFHRGVPLFNVLANLTSSYGCESNAQLLTGPFMVKRAAVIARLVRWGGENVCIECFDLFQRLTSGPWCVKEKLIESKVNIADNTICRGCGGDSGLVRSSGTRIRHCRT